MGRRKGGEVKEGWRRMWGVGGCGVGEDVGGGGCGWGRMWVGRMGR